MASNQTSNYGLNQWEATDQVLRTDFNSDNLKVDTALKSQATTISNLAVQITDGLAEKAKKSDLETEAAARAAADEALAEKAGMQLIQQIVLSADAALVRLEFTEIDWHQWATVHILIKPILDNNDSYRVTLKADTNTGLGNLIVGHFHLLLYPTFDQDMQIIGHFWPAYQGNQAVSSTSTFPTLECIECTAGTNVFHTGTAIEIWGSK